MSDPNACSQEVNRPGLPETTSGVQPAAPFLAGLRRILDPPADWLDRPTLGRMAFAAFVTAAGMACYGYAIGCWRSPLMGVYVAIKMPLLVGLTLTFNSLLNGLLALLLGSGLGFRQSFLALLTSFAIMALILGSLAPVAWMISWNTPPPDSEDAMEAHRIHLLLHTLLIALAGVWGNLRLHRLLRERTTGGTAATATLLAWLGGNCFLGAQFSYILRPFFGTPGLEVEFLRADPLDGSFHEAVWRMLDDATNGMALPVLSVALVSLLIPVVLSLQSRRDQPATKTT